MMRKKLSQPILAEGEVTGHAHVLDSSEAEVYELENGVREWRAKTRMFLRHEEHAVIALPPSPTGSYQSGRVVEYDAFEASARSVRD